MAAPGGTTRPATGQTATQGLSPDQAEEARRVGERLQAEMGALIRAFPLGARTIAGMSEWLGVTRPVCQRLVRGCRRRADALAALTFFPGVKGLHQVLEAARSRGIEAPIESARAAADRYAALIDRHGGSQKRLIALIEATRPGASSHAGAVRPPAGVREGAEATDGVGTARELAFRGIKAITRRSFETQFLLQIYQPQSAPAGDPLKMDALSVMGMLGVKRQPGSLPICPMSRYAFGGADAASAVPIQAGPTPADGPVTLLEPFCSKPLPRVVAKPGAGSTPVLVDPDSDGGGPFDVVLGLKARGMANPAAVGSDSRVQICSLVSDGPARNLVMVALLHRSLARASVPTAAAIAVGRRGPVDLVPGNLPEDRWFDRLPERPAVEVLGLGEGALGGAALPACPRLGELAEHLIRSQGWGVEEFVGFRVREEFPVWGAEYLISFGFEAGE